jgi:hypothetical protein
MQVLLLQDNMPVAMTPSGKELVPVKYKILIDKTNHTYDILIFQDDSSETLIFDQTASTSFKDSITKCLSWIDQIQNDNLNVNSKEIAQIKTNIVFSSKNGLIGSSDPRLHNNKCYLFLSKDSNNSYFIITPSAVFSQTQDHCFTGITLLFTKEELIKLNNLLDDQNIESAFAKDSSMVNDTAKLK